jgi:DNA-binding beta-propeller fold protein YncE
VSGGNAFDGTKGDGPGQFNEPVGLSVSPTNDVYVADRLNHRIQKFALDGSYVTEWGTGGEGPGQFREPHDVAADDQFVYVADTWNQRVQVFDANGNFIFEIRDKPALSSPRGVFARHDRIYLADSGNGVGRVFDRSGELLATVGQKDGSGPGHLSEPVDLVADRDGRIYILNSGNNRIEIFSPTGEVVGSIPIPGWTGPGLKESYLAIDSGDVIYMSDWDSGRIRRFQTDGTELTPVGPRSNQPCGVGIAGGRLIIAARAEHRLKGALLDGLPTE